MLLSDIFRFPGLTCEPIADADVDAAVALINEAYAYQDAHKGQPRTNPAHLRRQISQSEFYVVRQLGEIVGCLYVRRQEGSVHFGLLTVAQRLRGTGLAPALIKAVESYARKLGVQAVELDYMSVAVWLRTYYERFGYAETGQVTPWGSIDLIRMAKPLRSQAGVGRWLDPGGRLARWPTKRSDQLLALQYLVGKFESGRSYTEAEVNDVLKHWHTFSDWPLLRRELYEAGLIDRNRDGSEYRLVAGHNSRS
jgi:predicted N-acetyltransferase YhbS